jgi:hypothetical protein
MGSIFSFPSMVTLMRVMTVDTGFLVIILEMEALLNRDRPIGLVGLASIEPEEEEE